MSQDAIWLVIAVVAGALALAAWVGRERVIVRRRRRAVDPGRHRRLAPRRAGEPPEAMRRSGSR